MSRPERPRTQICSDSSNYASRLVCLCARLALEPETAIADQSNPIAVPSHARTHSSLHRINLERNQPLIAASCSHAHCRTALLAASISHRKQLDYHSNCGALRPSGGRSTRWLAEPPRRPSHPGGPYAARAGRADGRAVRRVPGRASRRSHACRAPATAPGPGRGPGPRRRAVGRGRCASGGYDHLEGRLRRQRRTRHTSRPRLFHGVASRSEEMPAQSRGPSDLKQF